MALTDRNSVPYPKCVLFLALSLIGCLTSQVELPSNPLASCDGLCAFEFWKGASLEEAKLALDAGIDPNGLIDPLGDYLPLGAVAQSNSDPRVASLLLSNGASIERGSVNGASPLNFALSSNINPEMTKLLLERGATIHSFFGESELHLAAQNDNPAVAHLVLGRGAEVNSPSDSGATPIFHAVIFGNIQTATLLIEAGADPYSVDHEGKTLWHMAAQSGASRDSEMVEWLLELGIGP